jgi:Tol biopolymer transport system component/tRNA A-37 threonylcarbamoyl transferase component Bud32
MSDIIGKQLGSYRVMEQIGVGGMATVYKAYHATMDRYVAVKILAEQMSKDPDFRVRFEREAKVIAKLEHAHILPVYDYGEAEGRLFLVMRYIDAGTLKDRMAAGPIESAEISHILNQVGAALAYAHRSDVVHRDIKPANVLLDAQGDCYLTDFGLAKMMEASIQLTKTGVGLGTPAYMSPEQGQGEKVDHRSDVYSLGVVLYELVTGQVPYQAETPLAVVLKHITAPLPLPSAVKSDVHPAVERVILRALSKNPDDRFDSTTEMAAAFELALAETKAAHEVSTPEELMPQAPDLRDAVAPPQIVQTEKQVADLYAQARQLHRARQWQAVLDIFARIAEIDPRFLDPENLLPTAQWEVAQLQRQARLDDLYSRAVREMQAGRWQQARELLANVTRMEPGFRDSESLLARIESEIARERQIALAALYADAVRLSQLGRHQAALEKWREVQAQDPGYPDHQNVEAIAEEGLVASAETMPKDRLAAALEATSLKRHPPGRVWILGGVFITLAIVGVLLAREVVAPAREPTRTAVPAIPEAPKTMYITFASNRDGDYEIYHMDQDAKDVISLTDNDSNERQPAWSPDGLRVAFASDRDGDWEIFSMDAQGKDVVQMTHNDADDLNPSWSPDGLRVAFASDRDGDWETFRMNVDGSDHVQFTRNGAYDGLPAWSPDGSRIAFVSDRDGDAGIYRMLADGSDPVLLNRDPARDRDPAWSPDGRYILFSSDRDGTFDVFRMGADGSDLLNFTRSGVENMHPAWAPDGTKIVFVSHDGDDAEIYLMDARGGNLVPLTFNDVNDVDPTWLP